MRMADAELSELGVDHGHVGAWLCRRWNLPDEIVDAVGQHHLRPANADPGTLAIHIDWADRLVHLFEGTNDQEVVTALFKDQAWSNWSKMSEVKTQALVASLREKLTRSLTMISLLN